MPIMNDLLVIIKPTVEDNFLMAAMLFLYVLQKHYLDKSYIFFEDLLAYIILPSKNYVFSCVSPTSKFCATATLLLLITGN
jgi:hypothetical protein